MPDDKITLLYFNFRGRAELARVIMAQAGIEYEDKRLEFGSKEWAGIKPTTPTGGLPLLTVNGVQIGQTAAVVRYLAGRAGLTGKDELEAARADMVMATVLEIAEKFVQIMFEPDSARADVLQGKLESEYLPYITNKLENMLKANGGNWIVGSDLTYADLALGDLFHPTDGFASKVRKGFSLGSSAPALAAHVGKVNDLPRVREWINKRPKSDK